jgi:hypothetical protein
MSEYKIDKKLFDIFISYIYKERIITQFHADESRIDDIIGIIKQQGFNEENLK